MIFFHNQVALRGFVCMLQRRRCSSQRGLALCHSFLWQGFSSFRGPNPSREEPLPGEPRTLLLAESAATPPPCPSPMNYNASTYQCDKCGLDNGPVILQLLMYHRISFDNQIKGIKFTFRRAFWKIVFVTAGIVQRWFDLGRVVV